MNSLPMLLHVLMKNSLLVETLCYDQNYARVVGRLQNVVDHVMFVWTYCTRVDFEKSKELELENPDVKVSDSFGVVTDESVVVQSPHRDW